MKYPLSFLIILISMSSITAVQHPEVESLSKVKKSVNLAISSEYFIEYCEPCIKKDPDPEPCKIEKVQSAKYVYKKNTKKYALMLNEREVDLAYIYVANRYVKLGLYTNLAQKVRLKTKSVPRSIAPKVCDDLKFYRDEKERLEKYGNDRDYEMPDMRKNRNESN